MKQNKKQKHFSFAKYLPVLVIMLSLSIIASSTFAFFTNRLTPQGNPTVNFGKVDISDGQSFEISTPLMDALPGDTIISSPIQFSVAEGSNPVYVRAKISYTTDTTTPEMLYFVNRLREANTTAYGATGDGENYKWGTKYGNYIYLEQFGNENTNLYQAAYNSSSNPTYTLVNSFKIPTGVKNLNGNDQYMKSVTVHIAIQAIQAENLGNRTTAQIKALFDDLFPESEAEKINMVTVTFKDDNNNAYTTSDYDFLDSDGNGTVEIMKGDRLLDTLTIADPTKENHTFIDWRDSENRIVSLSTTQILADTTIHSHFGSTVTFMQENPDYDSEDPTSEEYIAIANSSVVVEDGSTIASITNAPTLTKNLWNFIGWVKVGVGTYNGNATITQDTQLYPLFEEYQIVPAIYTLKDTVNANVNLEPDIMAYCNISDSLEYISNFSIGNGEIIYGFGQLGDTGYSSVNGWEDEGYKTLYIVGGSNLNNINIREWFFENVETISNYTTLDSVPTTGVTSESDDFIVVNNTVYQLKEIDSNYMYVEILNAVPTTGVTSGSTEYIVVMGKAYQLKDVGSSTYAYAEILSNVPDYYMNPSESSQYIVVDNTVYQLTEDGGVYSYEELN